MNDHFLLKSENAKNLYVQAAKDLPIIDFHNHISHSDLATNKRFENLYEIWLACDPYKHRLMRICGIEEHFITGDAEPFEKMEKFFSVFPYLVGTPVYDWCKMELFQIFGINEAPCAENVRYLYDQCTEKLASDEFSTNSLLSRFGVEYHAPVASILDDLSSFRHSTAAPSLRGDNLLSPTKEFIDDLANKTKVKIDSDRSYLSAISLLLDEFSTCGCRFADHSLDVDFFDPKKDKKQSEILTQLGTEYAKRGWTLLLHLGAKRRTSDRLAHLAGAAGGYAAAGTNFDLNSLVEVLNKMEGSGGLPDTVLFPLNLNDQAPIAILQGSFSQDHTPSKVQLGPAWWWCDHAMGIENALSCIASFGVLSQFIGMTTDSRSILSFVRHDYFRRILCSWLSDQNEKCEWNLPFTLQKEIIHKMCYQNAKDKIR